MPAMPAIPALTPVLVTAAFGWMYYRRIRSHFGRQRYRPHRLALRMGLLALALFGLLMTILGLPYAALPIAGGIVLGGALGVLALRHTRIEAGEGERWFTPNPWIGGALSLLLIGRLAWRWANGAPSGGMPPAMHNASPLTLGIASTLVSYYLVHGIGLVWRMRRIQAAPQGA
jgi:hypothetical protein